MGPTPNRNFRIEDSIWQGALQRANAEGQVLSDIMRGWLTDYAAGRKRVGPGVPGTVEVSRSELTKLRTLIDGILQ